MEFKKFLFLFFPLNLLDSLKLSQLKISLCFVILLAFVALFPTQSIAKPLMSISANKALNELSKMSLKEKIGQMLMPAVRVKSEYSPQDIQNTRASINKFHVGGYHFLLDDQQLHSSKDTKQLIAEMQKDQKIPLLIAADFEGGVGFYFKDATRLPRAMAIAAASLGLQKSKSGSKLGYLSHKAGQVVAAEALSLGFNTIFYPSMDVNNNPDNPIINIRSFSSDPLLVAYLGSAYIKGIQQNGLLAVAKHFPGHGNTTTDSHITLPVSNSTFAEIDSLELIPFKKAIESNVAGIMSAHILLPQIAHQQIPFPKNSKEKLLTKASLGSSEATLSKTLSKDHLPATLSPTIISGLLKDQLNFKGLVFSDAMMMGGIAKFYGEEEAAIKAINAGVDVILYPIDLAKTFEAIKQAVASKQIAEQRIDEAVYKILLYKFKLQEAAVNNNQSPVKAEEAQKFSQSLFQSAITLVKKNSSLNELAKSRSGARVAKVLLLIAKDPDSSRQSSREGKSGELLEKTFRENNLNVELINLAALGNAKDKKEFLGKVRAADFVVLATYIQVAAFKGTVGLEQERLDLMNEIEQNNPNNALFMFGNPYLIRYLPNFANILLAYENCPAAERAAARVVLGQFEPLGKLPVTINEEYKLGFYAD